MAYNALNNLIDAYIYANGVQAITGQILNGVLKQMVSQLGSGYHLMGVATPQTVPATDDYAMAYFAATAGEYTDFGGITLAAGEVAVLLTSGNGSWSKQTIYNVPTGTADLENTAEFITNAVTDLVNYYTKTEVDDTLANYPTLEALATALADYYTKTEIDTQKAETDAALADRYTKSETDTKLADYYKKTETYDKDEVDSIVATLSRQEYIVAWDGLAAPDVTAIPAGVTVTYSGTTYTGTLAASASTVNKIYMVWNGTAYDMYGTSQDGGYSWVPMGTTTVDLSQYATKAEVSQLEAEVDELNKEILVQNIFPASFMAVRNLRPSSEGTIVTGNHDYSYYTKVSNGDRLVINYTIDSLFLRYAFSEQIPGVNVPCTGYGSNGRLGSPVELTAPFDGYVLLAFDVEPSTLSANIQSSETIGAKVYELEQEIPNVLADIDKLENGITKVSFNTSSLSLSGFVIDGNWKKYSGYDSVCVPIRKYNANHIKVTANSSSVIAFLKDFAFSDSQQNTVVSYANGQTLLALNANVTAEYDIPADAEFVYLLVKSIGTTISIDVELSVRTLCCGNVVDIWQKDANAVIYGTNFITLSGYDSVNVHVERLHIYKVTANPYQDAVLTFLKSIPAIGDTVQFANGTQNEELIIGAGETKYIQIADDVVAINFATYNTQLSVYKSRRPFEVFDITDKKVGYLHPKNIVYVAASDSVDEDKLCADFICGGTADDGVIQKAVDLVSFGKFNAKGGEVVLFAGNYDINFRGNATAIKLPSVGTNYTDIDNNTNNVTIRGFTHNADNVNLNISQSTFDSLSTGIVWSVIGSSAQRVNYSHHSVQNIHINIPSATKKVICIDGAYMGSIECIDIICRVLDCGHYGAVGSYIPNYDCIGIRGTFGGNNMRHYEWKNCTCYGFGQGLAVNGEHLLIIHSAALFCKYGFTFNSFSSSASVSNHPVTLINCADEANFNLPKLCTLYDWRTQEPRGEMSQAIVFINFSLEIHGDWFAVEGQGKRMEEETPGQYYGQLTYTTWSNAKIFEDGSGLNIETNNLQCKKIGDSAYRRSVNFPQLAQFFDTTLNKMLIQIDRDNKVWIDTMGNVVS